jgi:hypothetical protein
MYEENVTVSPASPGDCDAATGFCGPQRVHLTMGGQCAFGADMARLYLEQYRQQAESAQVGLGDPGAGSSAGQYGTGLDPARGAGSAAGRVRVGTMTQWVRTGPSWHAGAALLALLAAGAASALALCRSGQRAAPPSTQSG